MKSIFIHTSQKYEIVLENVSNIATHFAIVPNESTFGPFFKFTPSEGILEIAEQKIIQIDFDSKKLGTFKEEFTCKLEVYSLYIRVDPTR
jgi:hydrocephalus-inducing protein